jgi:acyl-CoA thioesterase YciA
VLNLTPGGTGVHALAPAFKSDTGEGHARGDRPGGAREREASETFMEYTDPAIRLTLLPRDTNPQGTIFGGIILSYIDIAGAVEAHRRTQIERFVTVAMREVIFHQPVFVGDLVSFYASTVRVGTTSITIRVVVEAERYGGTSERIKVTEAEVVYVAVDANRRKMKINRDLIQGDTSGIEQHETS